MVKLKVQSSKKTPRKLRPVKVLSNFELRTSRFVVFAFGSP